MAVPECTALIYGGHVVEIEASELPKTLQLFGFATNPTITAWEWSCLPLDADNKGGYPAKSQVYTGTCGSFSSGKATVQNPTVVLDVPGGYKFSLRAQNSSGWSNPKPTGDGLDCEITIIVKPASGQLQLAEHQYRYQDSINASLPQPVEAHKALDVDLRSPNYFKQRGCPWNNVDDFSPTKTWRWKCQEYDTGSVDDLSGDSELLYAAAGAIDYRVFVPVSGPEGYTRRGFRFDGTNDYGLVNDNTVCDVTTGDFSISFWLIPLGALGPGLHTYVAGKVGWSNPWAGWYVYGSGTELRATVQSTSAYTATIGQLVRHRPHFVTIAFDRDGYCRGWINGVPGNPASISALSATTLTNSDAGPVFACAPSDSGTRSELVLWDFMFTKGVLLDKDYHDSIYKLNADPTHVPDLQMAVPYFSLPAAASDGWDFRLGEPAGDYDIEDAINGAVLSDSGACTYEAYTDIPESRTRMRRGVYFEGTDNKFVADDYDTGDITTGNFCVGIWFKRTAAFSANEFQMLVTKIDNAGTYNGWEIFLYESVGVAESSVDLCFAMSDGVTVLSIPTTTLFKATVKDTMYCGVINFDRNGYATGWLNGSSLIPVAISTCNGSLTSASHYLTVGSYTDGGLYWFEGIVAEVGIFKGLMTWEEYCDYWHRYDKHHSKGQLSYTRVGVPFIDGQGVTAYDFRMQEASGDLTDSISAAVCSPNGSPSYGTDSEMFLTGSTYRESISLNGSTDYFTADSDTTGDQTTNDFCVAAWFCPTSTFSTNEVQALVNKWQTSGGYGGWCIQLVEDGAGSVDISPYISTGSVACGGTPVIYDISMYAWHFLALNFDRDGYCYGWLDGVDSTVPLNISTASATIAIASHYLTIGRYSDQDLYYFEGEVGEVFVAKRLMSFDEYNAIWRKYAGGAGPTRPFSSTTVHYPVHWDPEVGVAVAPFGAEEIPVCYDELHVLHGNPGGHALPLPNSRTNIITNSRSMASGWTTSNATATDADDFGPDGLKLAVKLAATADNGYAEHDFATIAAESHTFVVFYKREASSDVSCRIGLWQQSSHTTEVAWEDLTATSVWQYVVCTGTAVANDTAAFIRVNTNGEAILVDFMWCAACETWERALTVSSYGTSVNAVQDLQPTDMSHKLPVAASEVTALVRMDGTTSGSLLFGHAGESSDNRPQIAVMRSSSGYAYVNVLDRKNITGVAPRVYEDDFSNVVRRLRFGWDTSRQLADGRHAVADSDGRIDTSWTSNAARLVSRGNPRYSQPLQGQGGLKSLYTGMGWDGSIYVGGRRVAITRAYHAYEAVEGDVWYEHFGGDELTEGGAGGITYDAFNPFGQSDDEYTALVGDGTNYFYGSSGPTTGANDLIIVLVARFKYDGSATKYLCGTRKQSGTSDGWQLHILGASTALRAMIESGASSATAEGPVSSDGRWEVYVVTINRDENSTNGMFVFTSGNAGTGVNPSAASASITDSAVLTVFSDDAPALSYAGTISDLLIYSASSIFSSGSTGATEMQNVANFFTTLYGGIYPTRALAGEETPTYTRATEQVVEVERDGVTKYARLGNGLKLVGEEWTWIGETRKNLLYYTENWAAGSWGFAGSRCSTTANDADGPYGASTAQKYVETGFTSNYTYCTFGTGESISTGACLLQVDAKANLQEHLYLDISDPVTGNHAGSYFDLANGTVGTAYNTLLSSGIRSLGDDWYRCWIVKNIADAGTAATAYIGFAPSDSADPPWARTWDGCNGTAGWVVAPTFVSGIDVSCPPIYSMTAAYVTYNADNLSADVTNLPTGPFTVSMEYMFDDVDLADYHYLFHVHDGTATYGVCAYVNISNNLIISSYKSGSSLVEITFPYDQADGAVHRLVVCMDWNRLAAWVDGVYQESTNAALPTGMTGINVGRTGGDTYYANCWIRNFEITAGVQIGGCDGRDFIDEVHIGALDTAGSTPLDGSIARLTIESPWCVTQPRSATITSAARESKLCPNLGYVDEHHVRVLLEDDEAQYALRTLQDGKQRMLINADAVHIDYYTVGEYGLDRGEPAASKWYANYLVPSAGNDAVLVPIASLNGPEVGPTQHPLYEFLGWARAGSDENIAPFSYVASGYTVLWNDCISIASYTSQTVDPPLAIDCSAQCPPTAIVLLGEMYCLKGSGTTSVLNISVFTYPQANTTARQQKKIGPAAYSTGYSTIEMPLPRGAIKRFMYQYYSGGVDTSLSHGVKALGYIDGALSGK